MCLLGFQRNKKLYTCFDCFCSINVSMTSVVEIVFSELGSVTLLPLPVIVGGRVEWG